MIGTFTRLVKMAAVLVVCSLLGGCDDVRVYGSVGYSSYSGYGGHHGGPGYGGSVRIGGRIY